MGMLKKSRQRRSRNFAVLTYFMYAPRVEMAAALLDGLFSTFPPADDGCLLLETAFAMGMKYSKVPE
jgi:hypothetical protein